MAKGNLFRSTTNTLGVSGGVSNRFEEGANSMADVPELSSLTLSDMGDVSQDQGRVESGIGVEEVHVDEHSGNSHKETTDRPGSECPSADAGYRSISIKRFPFEETLANHLVTPMASFDVMDVFGQDSDGDTNLHLAIIHKATSLAMLMIASAPNGEWLNIVNLLSQTPLHLAVITKQTNTVRRLMVAGARVDCVDNHGNTPLHIACREGYADIVDCLLRPVCYEETHLNTYDIPYQRVPQDLNTRNFNGHTCLHLAAMSTHLKVMDLLLSRGADVNVKDGTSGRTVLHYAAETGNRILLHFLLSQRRVNVSCRTFGDLTPLRLAAGRRYGDVVSVLISNGADLSDMDMADDDDIDDFHIAGQPVHV